MDFSFDTFVLNTYDDLKPYLDDLVNRTVSTKEETALWIKDYDLLQSQIQEDVNRRFVRHTCDTANEALKKKYDDFITEISPKLQEIDDVLNQKVLELPGIEELSAGEEGYEIWIRSIRKAREMYKEENISLKTQDSEKEKIYGETTGSMMIEHEGETLTLQQATKLIQEPDRNLRKNIYEKIQNRRLEDANKLDNLMTDLIHLRNAIAKNAGYESYVEYQWDNLNRFDYNQQDVFNFHEGVKQHIVPILQKIYDKRKQIIGVESLKPYDLEIRNKDEKPLKPFQTGEELLQKGIATVEALHKPFGDNLRLMEKNGRFDLGSRKGKRPGGYNCSMPVSLYPFIFMNAAGTQRDVETFVHEAGHAMHSFCMEGAISNNLFKNYPIEFGEVASMSMEFMSMYFWGNFYESEAELHRAQEMQIEGGLDIFPWISIIDSFQYWLYKNPDHTIAQRDEKFSSLLREYMPWIDYSGYEKFAHKRRQAQLHIFEVPFYYIEYGIAQLGAIGVWKNYMADPKKALEQYIAALSLGYTRKLPMLYETAGIPFDFSPARIKELAEFVWNEREKLIKE